MRLTSGLLGATECLASCRRDGESAGRRRLKMTRYRWFVTSTVLMCALFGFGLARLASQQVPHNAQTNDVVDRFQRTFEVLQNNEVATSGIARGETIYFYKCWMCHNKAALAGDASGL